MVHHYHKKIYQLNLNHCVFVATFKILSLPKLLSTTYFNLKEKSAFLKIKKLYDWILKFLVGGAECQEYMKPINLTKRPVKHIKL